MPWRRALREWAAAVGGAAALLPGIAHAEAIAPPVDRAAARLSASAEATEYWDLTGIFESGHRLFARFVVTNEGPGAQTAAANGYIVHPDGHVSEFRNGKQQGEWTLSPDRLYLDIASSTLDLHGPQRRLQVDSTGQAVKLDLRFNAGEVSTPAAQPGGLAYFTDVLQIGAAADGSMQVGGMTDPIVLRGQVALTHTWMDARESALILRRIEFVGAQRGVAVYASDIATPTGAHVAALVVQPDRATEPRGAVAVELGRAYEQPDNSAYPLPADLTFRAGDLTLRIRTEKLLLRIDPLTAVPQPLRFFLGLRSAPQRLWADASFQLGTAGSNAPVGEGRGILAVSYLNRGP